VFRVKPGPKPVNMEVIRHAASSCDPFLARPAADFLRADDCFALSNLFRALSRCPDIGFIRVITGSYRRWWIGSLLHFAEQ
jgi:hypothetical protein